MLHAGALISHASRERTKPCAQAVERPAVNYVRAWRVSGRVQRRCEERGPVREHRSGRPYQRARETCVNLTAQVNIFQEMTKMLMKQTRIVDDER